MNQDYVQLVLMEFLWTSPFIVVFCVGLIVTVRFKASNPTASRLVMIAFSMMLFNTLFSSFYGVWRSQAAASLAPGEAVKFGVRVASLSLFQSILSLSGWVLLILGLRKLFQQSPRAFNTSA